MSRVSVGTGRLAMSASVVRGWRATRAPAVYGACGGVLALVFEPLFHNPGLGTRVDWVPGPSCARFF